MQVTHFTVGEKGLGPSSGEKQEDRKDSLSRRSEPSSLPPFLGKKKKGEREGKKANGSDGGRRREGTRRWRKEQRHSQGVSILSRFSVDFGTCVCVCVGRQVVYS